VIIGYLEFLDGALEGNAEQRVLIDTALKAALQGAELTSRLLSFSRKQALMPRTVNLNVLIAGMMDLLKRTLGETIELQSVETADLAPVELDTGKRQTPLSNLAVNARYAMPEGGRLTIAKENITLNSQSLPGADSLVPGEYVMLTVSDTGTGMSPDILAHVFEPFVTTKDVGEGSGLGLSMVFGFARQSGGHVTIDSREGEGTTARLYFPVAGVAAAVESDPPKTDKVPEGRGESVLIVEDDDGLRKLAVRTLSRLGYRPVAAASGPAALALLDDGLEIDLLFTDVVLPAGMNGVALAEAVAKKQPGIRVLYTSGYTNDAACAERRFG